MAFSFSSLFAKKATSVLGVDIGSSSIKVVQLRRDHGQAVLETYGAIALGPYAKIEIGRATQLPVEAVVEALKDVVREANVSTNDAGFALPYASSLVSIVKLPAAVEDKLDQAMPLEARKYIPVAINEVQLDWSLVTGGNVGGKRQDKIEVMLVATQNSTIEKYQHIATGATLNESFLEIEVFSAVRASLDHGIAPVAVVDFGAATTKFYVVERGIMRESHIINHGSQELTLNAARALNIPIAQAEEKKRKIGLEGRKDSGVIVGTATNVDADMSRSFEMSLAPIISELSQSIISFEQRSGETINTLVCTGGGATLRGLVPYAQSKLQAEVRLADPFGKTEAPAFLEGILKQVGPEFSVAVGLALRRLQEIG